MQLKSKCYKITHGGHLIRIKTFNPSPKNSILTKKVHFDAAAGWRSIFDCPKAILVVDKLPGCF